jgi:glycosyltransferase involved in cell wall biosynthesis
MDVPHGFLSQSRKRWIVKRNRIILISVEDLNPLNGGGRVRTKAIVGVLAEEYEVVVVFPTFEPKRSRFEGGVLYQPLFVRKAPGSLRTRMSVKPHLGVYHLHGIKDALITLVAEHNPIAVIWSHSYLASMGFSWLEPLCRVQVVDFPNIEVSRSHSFARSFGGFKFVAHYLEYIKALIWEPKIARAASLVIGSTASDSRALAKANAETVLFRNPIPRNDFIAIKSATPVILSVANWKYRANVEGLKEFLREDFPLLLKQEPSLRLVVVGQGAMSLAGFLEPKGSLEFMGYKESLDDVFGLAWFFLAPAKSGAGSQLKIGLGLSYGRFVIAPAYGHNSTPEAGFQDFILLSNDIRRIATEISNGPNELSRKGLKIHEMAASRGETSLNADIIALKEKLGKLLPPEIVLKSKA